jgi:hypothetical protein
MLRSTRIWTRVHTLGNLIIHAFVLAIRVGRGIESRGRLEGEASTWRRTVCRATDAKVFGY